MKKWTLFLMSAVSRTLAVVLFLLGAGFALAPIEREMSLSAGLALCAVCWWLAREIYEEGLSFEQ